MRLAVPAKFALDDLLGLLREQGEPPEGFLTAREWAAHFGVNPEKMMGLLREAKGAGKLQVQWVPREALDGRMMRRPAYAFDLSVEEE